MCIYKDNISAALCLDIEIKWPSPIYDRDTKNKADELDRLHASMKEKVVTASNTAKLQLLTLVPDSWSRNYCSEYFYLIWSARQLKQRKGILAQTSQKKAKAMTQETTGSCFLWRWWIQQTAFPEKGLCKDTKMCSQTKGVSSVQSPWIVCCIQRKTQMWKSYIPTLPIWVGDSRFQSMTPANFENLPLLKNII